MVGRHNPPCSRAGRERLVFTAVIAEEGKGEYKLHDLPTGIFNPCVYLGYFLTRLKYPPS